MVHVLCLSSEGTSGASENVQSPVIRGADFSYPLRCIKVRREKPRRSPILLHALGNFLPNRFSG